MDRVAAAAVRIVADRGFDAVSVRQVAAEAGVSPGMVQHHFPTKKAMLLAAAKSVATALRTRAAATAAKHRPADALRELVWQLVPLDAERSTEGKLWLAFAARAAVDPEIGSLHRGAWVLMEQVLAEKLAATRHRAENPTAQDVEDAGLLLAMIDGLAVGGVLDTARLPPERIAALIDSQLARLAAGPPIPLRRDPAPRSERAQI